MALQSAIAFDPIRLPESVQALRKDVREFVAEQAALGVFDPNAPDNVGGFNRAFSRAMGLRGWIGLTWPKKYGGQERSHLEHYVLTEELYFANAPLRSHFVADRQSGPVLMKYGSEAIKAEVLPQIVAGECCFCIGMSEPGSGSDLFAAKTRATKVEGGWQINGTKLWTSNAHHAEYMIGLFRTSEPTVENRREGLTQFLVDMSAPGITVNPVREMTGRHSFNEVVFDDVYIPDSHVLGKVGMAWTQATSELAYERSGPERILETIYLLPNLIRALGPKPDRQAAEGLGRPIAQLNTMRRMSISVAGMLEAGKEPTLEGSLVKHEATLWAQNLAAEARHLTAFQERTEGDNAPFDKMLDYAIVSSPKLTIQGGTTEILRGIIARGLGIR